ncbi:DNA gyrase inhibitor YacG [mine drainage metagenome]|uniref:DNA gyrase inhibitor YacG n=1 Tax=mine drainage metagenome TaxID=410659 RepID=A0A1J5SCB8_9ZZZZ
MVTIKKRMVACPNCSKLSEFAPSNAFRPFCSERCKLIDLGLWASEQYAIPENAKHDDLSNENANDFSSH